MGAYLIGRLQDLRYDIVDFEELDYICLVGKGPTLQQLVGPELRAMIRDLFAAWEAIEEREGIGPSDEPGPF